MSCGQAGDAHLSPALMQSIATRVWEASFGFCKSVLVFEGGNAFQWRLGACLPAIRKATRRAHMTSQILVSGSPENTQVQIRSSNMCTQSFIRWTCICVYPNELPCMAECLHISSLMCSAVAEWLQMRQQF